MTTPPGPPPGWYPDPSGAPGQRYFDGRTWSENRAPAVPDPPRSAAVAGLLQLFFGWFGIGRFYIGSTQIAVIQLILGLAGIALTMFCFIGVAILLPLSIWTFIEALMMFSRAIPDSNGRKLS